MSGRCLYSCPMPHHSLMPHAPCCSKKNAARGRRSKVSPDRRAAGAPAAVEQSVLDETDLHHVRILGRGQHLGEDVEVMSVAGHAVDADHRPVCLGKAPFRVGQPAKPAAADRPVAEPRLARRAGRRRWREWRAESRRGSTRPSAAPRPGIPRRRADGRPLRARPAP